MISREQAETNLRQDIEYAWEPWYNRDTINRSQFSRAIRNALAPSLIEQYKAAALVLLRQFIEDDSIDMDEVDELADKAMSEHAAAIAEGVADTTVKWVEDDENPGRAFDRDRAELISITEITRARTMGEMAAAALLEDVDIHLVARWWTADDERVCPVCGPLHKTLEKFWSEFFPRGTPAHPRCVTGDTIVNATDIQLAFRSKYQGTIVRVEMSCGSNFAVTANHMLLSDIGFVKASSLMKGQNIVRASFVECDPSFTVRDNPNDNRKPVTAKEIFDSFAISSGVLRSQMPVATEDFHGDGAFIQGEIDVINAECFLRSESDVSTRKPGGKSDLVLRERGVLLNANSPVDLLLSRYSASPHFTVGGCRDSEAFLNAQFAHSNDVRFASGSRLNASELEAIGNRHAGYAKVFADLQNTVPSVVSLSQVVKVDFETLHDPILVYDFQTKTGLYLLSSGIASSNCRCWIDWKEKAKRKSRRTRKVGRMGRRSRRSGFGRMRSRSREEVEGFEIIKGRFLESKRLKPTSDSANRKSDDSSSLT